MYDVVIVGASFAGLAVASQLKGKILLLDKAEVGEGEKSTCGVPFNLIKNLGLKHAVAQKVKEAIIYFNDSQISVDLPEPYCTIDYKKFCQLLLKKSSAEFIKANAKGIVRHRILTNKSSYKAKIFVDASGPKAVLISSLNPNWQRHCFFGVNIKIPYQTKKFHFFINPKIIPNGYAWAFPAGDVTRFGVGSYATAGINFLECLKKFVQSFDLKFVGQLYGGFISSNLKDPIFNGIWAVGDAAGQALPLTGEGIRTAIKFGMRAGQEIQKFLDGKQTLVQAQQNYRQFVLSKALIYKILFWMQNLMRYPKFLYLLTKLLKNFLLESYFRI